MKDIPTNPSSCDPRGGVQAGSVHWMSPDWPLPPGVRALMSFRSGGYSTHPHTSWNLGTHVGDAVQAVEHNRTRLSEVTGAHCIFLNQVHGIGVVRADLQTTQGLQADAVVSAQPLVACTIMVADCLPVLLVRKDARCVGAAHAGWRGLAAGVLESAVETMVSDAPSVHASELTAWLGPCIGPTAFEVGDEVRQTLVQDDAHAHIYFVASGNKWLANLQGLARYRLVRAGLAPEAIFGNDGSAQWCTVGNEALYFSHRRDAVRHGTTGRMAACIWLHRYESN